MVHRDIKPSNLFICYRNNAEPIVKVLDLGLARVSSMVREDGGLRRTGQIMGTADYMAPEQAMDSRNVDIRSDIYSLGCTLFRALSGEVVFHGTSAVAKLLARSKQDAPSIATFRPDIPAGLADLIARMLARDPDNRPTEPVQIANALVEFITEDDSATSLEFDLPASETAADVAEIKDNQTLLIGRPVESNDDVPYAIPVNEGYEQFLDNLTNNFRKLDNQPLETLPVNEPTAEVLVQQPPTASQPYKKRRKRGSNKPIVAMTAAAFVAAIVAFVVISNRGVTTMIIDWPASDRVDTSLTIDDRDITIPANGPIRLEFEDGGTFSIKAFRKGYVPLEVEARIRSGETSSVELKWSPTPETHRRLDLNAIEAQFNSLKNSSEGALIGDGDSSVELRMKIAAFQRRHPMTTQATDAVNLLPQFEWPADRLDRERIPETALHTAGNGDASAVASEIVAIYGNGRNAHWFNVTDVKFSPDGRFVASSADDHSVRVWDPTTGQLVKFLQNPNLHATFSALAFSNDSTRLVGGSKGQLIIWNTDTWTIESSPALPVISVWSLGFDQEGRLLVGLDNGQIHLFDLVKQKKLQQFDVSGHVIHFCLSKDNSLLAAGANSGVVRIYTYPAAELKHELQLNESVSSVHFSPDGDKLVTSGGGKLMRLWDLSDPSNPTIDYDHQISHSTTTLSADGSKTFVGGWAVNDPACTILETETGTVLNRIGDDQTSVGREVAISPDGKTLVTASFSGLRFFDIESGDERFYEQSTDHRDRIVGATVNSRGDLIISTALDNSTIARDLETGSVQKRLRGSLQELAGGLAFHPAKQAFVYGDGSTLVLVDLENDRTRRTPERFHGPMLGLRYSPDGKHIVGATANGTLRQWNSTTGDLEREVLPGGRGYTFFDIRSDGLLAYSHNGEPTIGVFKSLESKQPMNFNNGTVIGGSIAVQPHGDLLACSQYFDTHYHIEVWSISQKKKLREFDRHLGWPFSLAIDPQGRYIASIRFGGLLELWDLESPIQTPKATIRIGNFGHAVGGHVFTPDGRHIVTGNGNGTIYVIRLPQQLID